jgi:hypothetical protein
MDHEETSITRSVSFAPSNDALRRAQSSSLAIFSTSAVSDNVLAEDSEFEHVRRPRCGGDHVREGERVGEGDALLAEEFLMQAAPHLTERQVRLDAQEDNGSYTARLRRIGSV